MAPAAAWWCREVVCVLLLRGVTVLWAPEWRTCPNYLEIASTAPCPMVRVLRNGPRGRIVATQIGRGAARGHMKSHFPRHTCWSRRCTRARSAEHAGRASLRRALLGTIGACPALAHPTASSLQVTHTDRSLPPSRAGEHSGTAERWSAARAQCTTRDHARRCAAVRSTQRTAANARAPRLLLNYCARERRSVRGMCCILTRHWAGRRAPLCAPHACAQAWRARRRAPRRVRRVRGRWRGAWPPRRRSRRGSPGASSPGALESDKLTV